MAGQVDNKKCCERPEHFGCPLPCVMCAGERAAARDRKSPTRKSWAKFGLAPKSQKKYSGGRES